MRLNCKSISILLGATTVLLATGLNSADISRQVGPRNTRPLRTRLFAQKMTDSVSPQKSAEVVQAFGALPLSFEPNVGQAPAAFDFVTHTSGYSVLLSAQQAIISASSQTEDDPYVKNLPPRKRKRFELTKVYRDFPRFHRGRRRNEMKIVLGGANPRPQNAGLDELPGKMSYFIGRDPQKWKTGIATYGRVRYSNVYPGVDLIYYGDAGRLEFDFVVSPGANPDNVSLSFSGVEPVAITKDGSLRIGQSTDGMTLHRPRIYQVRDGQQIPVEGSYALRAGHQFGFQLGAYDHSRALVIDPVLAYSTYLGGNNRTQIGGIAVDSAGNAYVTGGTEATNLPVENAYDGSKTSASWSVFVTKIDPTGTSVLYSTYLKGSSNDYSNAIAIDASDDVYITGWTTSSDFPVVNGFQNSLNDLVSGNAFITRIDTTQSGAAQLVYSTFLGGGANTTAHNGDVGAAIAVDRFGVAYVTGQTDSDASTVPFPTTPGAYQSFLASVRGDAFLSAVDTNRVGPGSLVYSTYLGGSPPNPANDNGWTIGDYGLGVTADDSGNAFITGATVSGGDTPFPTTENAYQNYLKSPNGNAFVSEIATRSCGHQSLVYSTYFGGSSSGGDLGVSIALNGSGKIYVAGETSSPDFPVSATAYQTTRQNKIMSDFVSELDLSQTGTAFVMYSTYLDDTGFQGDIAASVVTDSSGDAFVFGATNSSTFPVTAGAVQATYAASTAGGYNAFLTVLNPSGTGLLYSTYLGGSITTYSTGGAIDTMGNVYWAGHTADPDFPVYPQNAVQTSFPGAGVVEYESFVAKIVMETTPSIVANSIATGKCGGMEQLCGGGDVHVHSRGGRDFKLHAAGDDGREGGVADHDEEGGGCSVERDDGYGNGEDRFGGRRRQRSRIPRMARQWVRTP